MKKHRLLVWDNWYKNTMVCHKKHYLLSIFRVLTVSLLYFFNVFLSKQRWRSSQEWFSSLWLKFVKNKDQYSQPFSLARNVIFSVDCFLRRNIRRNLSEEKKISKHEIDLLNFILDVIFKQCLYLSTVTKEHAAIFWSWYNWIQSKNFI